jgi:genome maintenance exonuclease 1
MQTIKDDISRPLNFQSLYFPIDLEQTKDDTGERVYVTPEGIFHSVTRMLSWKSNQSGHLQKWRSRVGEKEAQNISTKAANRVTKLHKLLETFMLGETFDKKKIFPNALESYRSMVSVLEKNISNVYASEIRMFSKRLRLAGTADGIVEWNNKLTILDFKTSSKLKKEEWIDNYKLQCAAYSMFLLEGSKGTQHAKNGVVLIAVDDEIHPQIFEFEIGESLYNEVISLRNDYEKHLKYKEK